MKLILAGGGTAGHCIPNLALLPKLKKHFDEISYIGRTEGIEKDLVEGAGLPYFGVDTCKLVRGFSFSAVKNNLSIPFRLHRAKKRCEEILKAVRPSVVFLKGGFVCLPVALAARKLKIPFLCHESDYSLGLSNRLSKKGCTRLLTAFENLAEKEKRAYCVGAPIREELFTATKKDALLRYGFNTNKPVLLVVGGSSGAKGLNDLTQNALPLLLARYQVLHIVGKNTSLPKKQRGYFPLLYESEMKYAYAAADYCISRAGANALFELLALKLPTLAVPLPTGRGDQRENAAYFYSKGALLTAEERALNPKILLEKLAALERQAQTLKRNAENLHLCGANARIAEEILRVASEKKSHFQ